jgi:GNAT superfamily N-acetyltransferase
VTASSSKYRIRQVAIADFLPELREMQRECLPGNSFQLDSGAWFLAFFEGHCLAPVPVGYAKISPSRGYDSCGYLACAGIMPKHRGHGLQRLLIRRRERYARGLGWLWLISHTTENTVSANNLIEQGFRLFEPKKLWAKKKSLYWRKYIGRGPEDEGPI